MLVKDLSPTEALGTQNERLSVPFDMGIHKTGGTGVFSCSYGQVTQLGGEQQHNWSSGCGDPHLFVSRAGKSSCRKIRMKTLSVAELIHSSVFDYLEWNASMNAVVVKNWAGTEPTKKAMLTEEYCPRECGNRSYSRSVSSS